MVLQLLQVLSSLQQQTNQDSLAQQSSALSLGDPRGNLPSGVASHSHLPQSSFQPPTSLDVAAVPQQALGGVSQQAGHDALAKDPSSLSLGKSFGFEQFIPNLFLNDLSNPSNDPLVNQVFLNEVPVTKSQNTALDPSVLPMN